MRKGKLLVLRDEGEIGTTWQAASRILLIPIPISARLDLSPKKEVVGQSMRQISSGTGEGVPFIQKASV